MVEVDALTAARRARQRRKKELQRHGQAVLRRVLGVALLSAAALLYGASSNYTSHKDKEFGSGAGMLYGVGVVALPGTMIGLYVAYGPGNAMARSAKGFAVLVVIPALGVLGIVLNLVLTQQMDRETRNFGVFFGSFAAVLAGLAIHLTWSLVAAANSSSRVPGAAAGWLGTWICVLIMAPLGVAGPLILFRKNGRVLHQWFGVVSPIRQAREQTLGLGEGGKKLSPFSKAGLYFNGIKIVSAAVAPVMTTLFSAFVCDTCEPSPRFLSRMSVRCGSATHVLYLICGLVAALSYYPLIAYLQPQLQFKSKSLDLKFEPTYLVLVAQTKLSLAVVVNFWSEDRSRRCGEGVTASQRLTQGAQQLGIAAVLCGFLAYRTLQSRPCIVAEFNVARFALLSAAALFLVASLICDGLQRGLNVGMDLARFVAAGLWLLAVLVVGWVSRRRLRRIDEERLAAAKDDDDGEDPVLLT